MEEFAGEVKIRSALVNEDVIGGPDEKRDFYSTFPSTTALRNYVARNRFLFYAQTAKFAAPLSTGSILFPSSDSFDSVFLSFQPGRDTAALRWLLPRRRVFLQSRLPDGKRSGGLVESFARS